MAQGNSPVFKLLIFSASNIVATSLALLYNAADGFSATAFHDETLFLEELTNVNLDVVLLREDRVAEHTFALIDAIRVQAGGGNPKIVVLGQLANDASLINLITKGVDGYFSEAMQPEHLLFLTRNIACGIPYYSMKLLAPMIGRLAMEKHEILSDLLANADFLTKRELEIVQMLCKGHSITEIGDQFFISKSTVKNHLSNIYRKMGVKNRAQAMITALKQGLVAQET